MKKIIIMSLLVFLISFSGCQSSDKGYYDQKLNDLIAISPRKFLNQTFDGFPSMINLYQPEQEIYEGQFAISPKLICGYIKNKTYKLTSEYAKSFKNNDYLPYGRSPESNENYFGISYDLIGYLAHTSGYYTDEDGSYYTDPKHPISFYDFTGKDIPIEYDNKHLLVVFYQLEITYSNGENAYLLIPNQGYQFENQYVLSDSFLQNEWLSLYQGAKFLIHQENIENKYFIPQTIQKAIFLVERFNNNEMFTFEMTYKDYLQSTNQSEKLKSFLTTFKTALVKEEIIVDDIVLKNQRIRLYYDYQEVKKLCNVN